MLDLNDEALTILCHGLIFDMSVLLYMEFLLLLCTFDACVCKGALLENFIQGNECVHIDTKAITEVYMAGR